MLAQVWLPDGRDFGTLMLSEGLARELTTLLPYEGQSGYWAAEAVARANGVGLWAPGGCAAALAAGLDPNDARSYVPGASEVPAGFVHVLPDTRLALATRSQGVAVTYRRPDDGTELLIISATLLNPADANDRLLQVQRGAPIDSTATVYPLGRALGDDAVVIRTAVESDPDRLRERVRFIFRRGAYIAEVHWTGYADQPNYDQALQVARLIDHRALLLAPQITSVVPATVLGEPSTSPLIPTPPPTATPIPTVTPQPTPTSSPTPAPGTPTPTQAAATNTPRPTATRAVPTPTRTGVDRDCSDFRSQAEAQAFFIANGGPTQDPHGLDGDRNGIACESLR
jgi:hypothetical protein